MTLVISVSQSCIEINLIFFLPRSSNWPLDTASEVKCEVVEAIPSVIAKLEMAKNIHLIWKKMSTKVLFTDHHT